MFKRCTPCISQEIKDLIGRSHPTVRLILAKMPTCVAPKKIQLCIRGGKKEKGSGRKSAYTEFVGNCMRGKHIKGFGQAAAAMKSCAAEWRASKSA